MTRFEDMTVTGLTPLELTRTGDADPLPFEPDTLVGAGLFQLDDRVRCEITNNGQVIVHGIANGVDIQSIVDAAVASAIALVCPVGTVTWMPRATAPTGWLLLDGSTKLIADYPDLFDVIGEYVVADATNFTLPNAKGRALVGYDSAQTEFNSIFKTGGAKTHGHDIAGIARIQVSTTGGNWAAIRRATGPSGSWTATHRNGPSSSGDTTGSSSSTGAELDATASTESSLQPYLVAGNAFIKY